MNGRFIPRHRVLTRALYILGAAGVVALGQTEPTPAAVQTFVGVVPAVSTTSFESGAELDFTVLPVTMGLRGSRASIRVSFPFIEMDARVPAFRIGGPILGITIPEQGLSEQGPGDVVLTPSLLLVRGELETPSFWVHLRVKAPTADETKYLGTGETDYAPGFGLLVPTPTRLLVLATARYNIRGDPPDVELENTVSASLGTIVRVGEMDAITVAISRDFAFLEGADPVNAGGVSWFHPFDNGTALSTTALVGLAAEARTYGVAIGITFNDGPFDWGGGS